MPKDKKKYKNLDRIYHSVPCNLYFVESLPEPPAGLHAVVDPGADVLVVQLGLEPVPVEGGQLVHALVAQHLLPGPPHPVSTIDPVITKQTTKPTHQTTKILVVKQVVDVSYLFLAVMFPITPAMLFMRASASYSVAAMMSAGVPPAL